MSHKHTADQQCCSAEPKEIVLNIINKKHKNFCLTYGWLESAFTGSDPIISLGFGEIPPKCCCSAVSFLHITSALGDDRYRIKNSNE